MHSSSLPDSRPPLRIITDDERAAYDTAPRSVRLVNDERPLLVLPSLAAAVGLDRAVFLQQLHYWLTTAGHERDGRRWVFNTRAGWCAQFPFWSPHALGRICRRLEADGLIITTRQYNRVPTDQTRWYTINYDNPALAALSAHCAESHNGRAESHIGGAKSHIGGAKSHAQCAESQLVIGTETTSEITTETTPENDRPPAPSGGEQAPRRRRKEIVTDDDPPGFAAFWSAYPRHEERKQAVDAWRKLAPPPEMQATILAAVAAQRASAKWREGFVKYGHRWLRDRNWTDEVQPAGAQLGLPRNARIGDFSGIQTSADLMAGFKNGGGRS